jgi:acyl-CoA synthetase (AMP-forming)/AMP-acid ligase II
MIFYQQLDTLDKTLPFQAERQGNKLALITPKGGLTYRQFNQRTDQGAQGLLSLGLPQGARVAYLGQECSQYFELIFACAKSKNVLVPINWRLTEDEVTHILADSAAEVLLVDAAQADLVEKIRPQLANLRHVFWLNRTAEDCDYDQWLNLFPAEPTNISATEDTPLAQLYTSGTTGLPKGVVLAHRSFFKVRNALHSESLDWIDWYEDDIAFIGIPGFHIGGLWWCTQAFNAGVTCVSIPTFNAAIAVQLIAELKITTMCVVPAMIQMMLSENGADQQAFASLRKVVYGGSPIAETLLQQGIDIMRADFAQIYGLTETGNTAVCLPPYAHQGDSRRLKAAGRPYPGFKFKIIDVDGNELPTGAVGEVCIYTPSRMLEYWQRPDATAETLVDDWICTGDAGYLDEQGFLFICDRLKDTIIVAGENVYPAEIENVLCKCKGVKDAAVIGIPDERWGEAILACLVFEPGSNIGFREVMAFLKGKIADFKIPAHFEQKDEIPRNASGKILRRVLRKEYWADRDRMVN